MGYSTNFNGVLKFTKTLNAKEIARLSKVLGEDTRELDDEISKIFDEVGFQGFYIFLEFTEDYDGLQWPQGQEKTYGMVEAINGVIGYMKAEFKDFGLEGDMHAQGDEVGDIWKIVMEDNVAKKYDIKFDVNPRVKCPECGHIFDKEE
jgi:hypothetical protein